MIRLVFADLRDHAAAWIGAFAVALACGCIGGWAASLMCTADAYTGALRKGLQNAGSMMLVFSLVAAVAVLASAANLTVSSQRRSYALWQLANVRSRLVSAVVLAQLAVVAVLGAVCGTSLASATFIPLFPVVFEARAEYAQVIPCVNASLMPMVWLAVAGVFLAGGLRGALSAGKTPPLLALREPEWERRGMTWMRTLLFAGLAFCTCWIVSIMLESEPDAVMDFALYLPVFVVATLAPLAPVIFSVVLGAWTALVPQTRFDAWYVARRAARFGLSASTSVETPIMVGFGLVAGIFSIVNVWAGLALRQGVGDISGYSLDSTTAILLLGGPVALCAVGAAVSVVMSSRSRIRDVALLTASGARPSTLVAAAVCEAFIHVVTATLVGAASVVASTAIVAYSVGMPLLGGLAFGEGLIVSLAGFALVLASTLIPTCAALRRETVAVLTVQE